MMYTYILILVQIITESFPISSSGHVALVQRIFKLHDVHIPTWTNAPTLFIVPLFFAKQWVPIFFNWRRTYPFIMRIALLTIISDVVTVCWYLGLSLFPFYFPLSLGFAMTACALFSSRWCTKTNGHWSVKTALLLGFFQGVALLPGISRLGMTYVVARWCAIPQKRAFEISWLIVWPLIVADMLKLIGKELMLGFHGQLLNLPIILVMVGGSIGGWYALGFMHKLVRSNHVYRFGWYLMVPLCISLIV